MSTLKTGALRGTSGTADTMTLHESDGSVEIPKLKVGSDAAGDVLYHNGTNYVRLPKGTDGHVLTLASGIPSWAAAAGGLNPMCWSHHDGQRNVDHNTQTKMFDSETIELGGSDGYATGRWTPTVSGKYLCMAHYTYNIGDEENTYRIRIVKNGSTVSAESWARAKNSENKDRQFLAVVGIVTLNGSGDYVEPMIHNTKSSGNGYLEFWNRNFISMKVSD